MDNREAFERIAKKVYPHINLTFGDSYIDDETLQLWQFYSHAIAHNRDAVIDDYKNMCLSELINLEKRVAHDIDCTATRIVTAMESLRSLKANKEG